MYLRFARRIRSGKEHRYWSIVESKRCVGGKVVQRPVLYLGEINDSQHADWCRVIETLDADNQRYRQLALFPADRSVPEHAKGYGVQVRLEAMQLHRPRQWGACWLACELYEQLQFGSVLGGAASGFARRDQLAAYSANAGLLSAHRSGQRVAAASFVV